MTDAPETPTPDLRLAYARIREALEPFARIAGPINGEEGRPTYLEAIEGNYSEPSGELFLGSHFGSGREETLWADDFRRARDALQADHIIGLSVTGEGIDGTAVARIEAEIARELRCADGDTDTSDWVAGNIRIADLRALLDATPGLEPRGCPTPGACSCPGLSLPGRDAGPAKYASLSRMLDEQIEREGSMSSFMVRAGLLKEILYALSLPISGEAKPASNGQQLREILTAAANKTEPDKPSTPAEIDEAIDALVKMHRRLMSEIGEGSGGGFVQWSLTSAQADCWAIIYALVELERAKAALSTPSDGWLETRDATLEEAARIADKWRDENRAAMGKAAKSHSEGARNMVEMLEGAAIECNAIGQAIRALKATPEPGK